MDPLLVKKNGNLASGGGLGRGYRERERKKERKKERTGRERERERERSFDLHSFFAGSNDPNECRNVRRHDAQGRHWMRRGASPKASRKLSPAPTAP